jgi:hypothetical protein
MFKNTTFDPAEATSNTHYRYCSTLAGSPFTNKRRQHELPTYQQTSMVQNYAEPK